MFFNPLDVRVVTPRAVDADRKIHEHVRETCSRSFITRHVPAFEYSAVSIEMVTGHKTFVRHSLLHSRSENT